MSKGSYMMSDPKVVGLVEEIIETIKVLGLDGETIQYILEETGNDEQMLRQLIMQAPIDDVLDLLEEKQAVEEEEE